METLEAAQLREHARSRSNLWARINLPMTMSVQLVDISLGGARFARELPCTPGVPIAFVLEVPGLGKVPITATVVWVDDSGTGVRFTGMAGERADALRQRLMAEGETLHAVAA